MASYLENYKVAMTEIRNNLVCAICEDPLRPGKRQWYRCMKLHQICQDCKAKNEKCSCDQPISLEYCKQTEMLLSVNDLKLEFKCVNTKNGCRETFTESALEDHETKCIHRIVPCVKSGYPCDTENEITFQNIIQHYEKEHMDNEKIEEQELNTKIELKMDELDLSGVDCYIDPIMFVFDNQPFLLTGNTTDDVLYRWVYMLGSPNDARHYAFILKLFGQSTKISFEGKVSAIDETFETLKNEAGRCFAIPHENYIAQFLDENCDEDDRKYEYSLEIRNLKEEAKDENIESGISDDDEDSKK